MKHHSRKDRSLVVPPFHHRRATSGFASMDIIPPLLPDEYLEGYRGRLGAFNAFGERNQVSRFVSRLQPDGALAATSKRSFLDSVAIINQKSISDVVMAHTLWPLMAAIGRPSDPADIESIARHPIANFIFTRKARSGLWLCHDCVKEDLRERKFTYWRCSHQVPGRHSCQAHRTQLRVIGMEPLMVDAPDEVLHRAEGINEDLFAEIERNPLASRFGEFIDAVLKEKIIFEYSSCLSALRSAMCPADNDIHPKLPLERFLSRLENSLSVPWLSWVMPSVSPGRGHRAHFFSNWTITNTARFSITTLAIIASTIFSSTDEAIRALQRG